MLKFLRKSIRFSTVAWPIGLVPEVRVDYGAVKWSRQQMLIAVPLGNLTEAADLRSFAAVWSSNVNGQLMPRFQNE